MQREFLRRCDQPEAVLSLLRIMARTPYGSWVGCPYFGLRELMEKIASNRQRAETAAREMNLALEDLGIVNFRIEKIVCESPSGSETSTWSITLASSTEKARTVSFDWSGNQ